MVPPTMYLYSCLRNKLPVVVLVSVAVFASMAVLFVVGFLCAIIVRCPVEASTTPTDFSDCCCPYGWVARRDRCYFSPSDAATHRDAVRICRSHDAELVSIHSPEENEFVRTNFTTGKHNGLWIGLEQEKMLITRDKVSWKVFWIDETPLDYQNWTAKNTHCPHAVDCIAYMHSDGKWEFLGSDVNVIFHYRFVCVKNMSHVDLEMLRTSYQRALHDLNAFQNSNKSTSVDKFVDITALQEQLKAHLKVFNSRTTNVAWVSVLTALFVLNLVATLLVYRRAHRERAAYHLVNHGGANPSL